MGILVRYERKKKNDYSVTFDGISGLVFVKFCLELLDISFDEIFQWILVSEAVKFYVRILNILSSISCASVTTSAYLGEFHDAKNRGRVLMIGKFV